LLAVIHLVQADLALRLYRADRGDWPAELADLVPAYLPGVPVDTLVGRPLIYRRTGGEFLLYSVGNDGLDQGGKFTNRATYFPQDGFDFDLDTFTRP